MNIIQKCKVFYSRDIKPSYMVWQTFELLDFCLQLFTPIYIHTINNTGCSMQFTIIRSTYDNIIFQINFINYSNKCSQQNKMYLKKINF